MAYDAARGVTVLFGGGYIGNDQHFGADTWEYGVLPSPLDQDEDGVVDACDKCPNTVPGAAVFVPTLTGTTARMISRFKPRVWTVAVSQNAAVCQGLAFSYGVHAVHMADEPEGWRDFARNWLREHQVPHRLAILVAGPSPRQPDAEYRIEFLRFAEPGGPDPASAH